MDEATRSLTGPGGRYEIAEAVIAGRPTRYWRTIPQTIRELVEGMPAYGDREYLVFESERITYRVAYRQIATLAARMREQYGIKHGDRVAIAMRNYPEWPLAFWATTAMGAIAVPLNAWWQAEELAYGLQDSGARLLFADDERLERIKPRRHHLDLRAVAVRTAPASLSADDVPFESLLAAELTERLPDAQIVPEDDATIFYTSGTTGQPKGALGTHRNLCTNVGSAGFMRARAAVLQGDQPAAIGPGQPQNTALISVPFFHVTGCHSRLAFGTYTGTRIVTMRRFEVNEALDIIEREQVNGFGGVPTVVWQVLESPDLPSRKLQHVTSIGYGGAPAAPELVRRIKAAFPSVQPSNGYGLTETSAITTMNIGQAYERKPDSVGPAIPVCDVKVIDAQGNALPAGEIGELCIRGPNVIKGYWNKPEATAKSFRDGFLHTGDVARIDADGFVYILDRAKDMLIRGGENVYCVEVESALHTHPNVLDVAVLGVAHRTLGEEVGAVVQVRAGSQVAEHELQAHAAQRLAKFKVPVRFAFFDEALPRNANGKILKTELRTRLGWDQE